MKAIARAAVGALVMAVALGFGGVASDWFGPGDGFLSRLLPALVVSVIAVPAVLLLWTRWRRRPVRELGLTDARSSLRAFGFGVAVTGGSAVVVIGAGTAAGWVRWGAFDLVAVLGFVLTNGIVALLLEALPEELTLRGFTWAALRERHRQVIAAVGTTLLFLLIPGASSLVTAGVRYLLGEPPGHVGIAPEGEDLVSYLMLLTMFGVTLVAARVATRSASLWTCIATHLTFLTVNRIVLQGAERDTGWSAELTTPDAVILIPVYLAVALTAYVVVASLINGNGNGNE